MDLLFYLCIFIIGCSVGSFLTVIVDRLPRSEGFITGRSYCVSCKQQLSWRDLIPLFSFVALRGKCRYCKEKLSLYYPIIEALTGLLFALTLFRIFGQDLFVQIGNSLLLLASMYFLFLVACLIIIFFTDLKYGIIPFKVVFSAIAILLLFNIYSQVFSLKRLSFDMVIGNYWLNCFLSAFIVFVFFFSLFFFTHGKGLGFGDVVYAVLMGLVLGFPKILLGVYIAFLSGAVVSLLLVVTKRKKFHGSTIPFGPFLVLGTFISLFWGDILIAKILTIL